MVLMRIKRKKHRKNGWTMSHLQIWCENWNNQFQVGLLAISNHLSHDWNPCDHNIINGSLRYVTLEQYIKTEWLTYQHYYLSLEQCCSKDSLMLQTLCVTVFSSAVPVRVYVCVSWRQVFPLSPSQEELNEERVKPQEGCEKRWLKNRREEKRDLKRE